MVASYTLLSAIGRLNRVHLALNSPDYDPQVHYQQVRDAGMGCARRPESSFEES